jgi:hypothetical protein
LAGALEAGGARSLLSFRPLPAGCGAGGGAEPGPCRRYEFVGVASTGRAGFLASQPFLRRPGFLRCPSTQQPEPRAVWSEGAKGNPSGACAPGRGPAARLGPRLAWARGLKACQAVARASAAHSPWASAGSSVLGNAGMAAPFRHHTAKEAMSFQTRRRGVLLCSHTHRACGPAHACLNIKAH